MTKHYAGDYDGTPVYSLDSHWNGAEGWEVAEADDGRRFWRDRYGDSYDPWVPVKWTPPRGWRHPWRE